MLGDDLQDVKDQRLKNVSHVKTNETADLLKELQVAEGLTYETSHKISVHDGICNGTPCKLRKIQYLFPEKVLSYLWVEFPDKRIGKVI